MNPIQIAERIYAELSAKIQQGVIPVALRAPSLIGTVQDDPFGFRVGNEIRQALPKCRRSSCWKADNARYRTAT